MPQILHERVNAERLDEARPSAPIRPDPCADDKPVCPACGGLECLCRPRFFPGQLLTDDNLNQLQRYVVEKNKLHNRYLHGWGVACGMEVVCDPCTSSNVVVRNGYALSPCGDDIVVCKDHSVDVCKLIEECRPQTEVVCDPPAAKPPRECRDGVEQWVLAVCYDERPSRGMTALTGSTDSACCSSCSCGGSGSCGCGGGPSCSCGDANKRSSATGKRKTYQPNCEPTQVCETYRFTAYRAPKPTATQFPKYPIDPAYGGSSGVDLLFAWMYANRAKFGPLVERLLCCVIAALELRATYREGKYANTREAIDVYRDYYDALHEFAMTFAIHRCDFLDKLKAYTGNTYSKIESMRGYDAYSSDHTHLIDTGLKQLDRVLVEMMTSCFCSALLPACPEPATDNCVPLAVLTVRTRDCRVVEICNWQARKLLITWRTVGYWLSWMPWYKLQDAIARLCCGATTKRSALWPMMVLVGMVMKQGRAWASTADAASMERKDAAVKDEAFDRAFESENLVAHLVSGFDKLRSGSDDQAPDWASLIARLADGSAFAPLAGDAAEKSADLNDLDNRLGLAALRQEVSDLHATLAEYRSAMDGLKNLVKGKGG